MWTRLTLACVALLVAKGVLADLRCHVKSSMSAADYSLSEEAANGIRFRTGQNATDFKALECTCDPRNVRKPKVKLIAF